MNNYYSVLQIEQTASQEEIKQAYHKMARLFHPDNFNGSREMAEEQMAKVNEAYAILSDVEKRKRYDMDLNNRENENHATVDRTDTSPSDTNVASKEKKESSCLTKVIEWAIFLGVLCFVVNHFNLGEIVKAFLGNNGDAYEQSADSKEGTKKIVEPDQLVENYLELMRHGDNKNADKLFLKTADQNFQTCTVSEYNQTVANMYYGFDEDIPTYPLFEEIRNFEYVINGVESSPDGNTAKVNIDIQNCDISLVFGLILQADESENMLAGMSDLELQQLFRNAIANYRETCLISTNATFFVERIENGSWRIDSISPLKDFSTVLVGQADHLIMSLNGESSVDNNEESEDSIEFENNEEYDDSLLFGDVQESTSIEPAELVETYLEFMRRADTENADMLFLDTADENFVLC